MSATRDALWHGKSRFATGRRWVQAGRKFTLTLTNRVRHVRGGRYMLTTTLRPINGQVWTASERVRVR